MCFMHKLKSLSIMYKPIYMYESIVLEYFLGVNSKS
jgi:hypothetical protein